MSTVDATSMLRHDQPFTARPWLDEFGLLHIGSRWVALSDAEWRLLEPLVAHFGRVVHPEELVAAAWPGRKVGDGALQVLVQRARRRVEPLGFSIFNVRSRGFLLDHLGSRGR